MYDHATGGKKYGITAEGVSYEYKKIADRKTKVVRKLVAGIKLKMQEHGVEVINGEACITEGGDECVKIAGIEKAKCSSVDNLGVINDITALAKSSNVYQFKIAMELANFDYSYNKKFVINNDVYEKDKYTYYEKISRIFIRLINNFVIFSMDLQSAM